MTLNIQKFQPTQAQEIKIYYEKNGYVVIQDALDAAKIDHFMEQYEKIKHNKAFLYFSQSIHRWLRPRLTDQGFIEESMLNPTRLRLFPWFSSAIEHCLFSSQIADILSNLSGFDNHVIWQNMFFDRSTGTIEHQDHWYLDTNPPGKLIAVWYALEDIHPEAGCFFVVPESHKLKVFDREDASAIKSEDAHNEFRYQIIKYVQDNDLKYKMMPLKKGDILLWHPYTIHGSYQNQNPAYSRKSFTAHFHPLGLQRLYVQECLKVRSTVNPRLYITCEKIPDWLWNLKSYPQYLQQLISGEKAFLDMRRNSY